MPKSNTRKKYSQYLELGDPDFPDEKCRLIDGSIYRVIDLEQIEYIKVTKKLRSIQTQVEDPNQKRNNRFHIEYIVHFRSGKKLTSGGSVDLPRKGQKKDDPKLRSHGSGDEGLKILKAWREYKGLDTPNRKSMPF